MKKRENNHIFKLTAILWGILAILLGAAPCSAQFVDVGETIDIDYATGGILDVFGTANLYPGAYIDYGIYAYPGSTINIYGGEIGVDPFYEPYAINVYSGANVTIYGTDFIGSQGANVNGTVFTTCSDSTSQDYGTGVLQGTYENGQMINLFFYGDIPINLAPFHLPVANDDIATTDQDTSVTIDVLANDTDEDEGDDLLVVIPDSITSPSNGTAVLNDDDTVTYTPEPGFNGTDSFTYEASDGKGGTDTATVTVTVGGGEGPLILIVDIDIKPCDDHNRINLDSKGLVPVAVLTTDDFDAATVDPAMVEFAGAAPVSWKLRDVNDDGNDDMIFNFRTQDLDLDQDSTEATLTGQTTQGVLIEGSDEVQIVSFSRKCLIKKFSGYIHRPVWWKCKRPVIPPVKKGFKRNANNGYHQSNCWKNISNHGKCTGLHGRH